MTKYNMTRYTEKIMRDAETENFGIKIGGRPISNLRYADGRHYPLRKLTRGHIMYAPSQNQRGGRPRT